MTARSTGCPRWASTSFLRVRRTRLESSSGVNFRPCKVAVQSLPICRLKTAAQRSGRSTCSSLAARPTSSLPSSSMPMTEGVKGSPRALGKMRGPSFSRSAAAEFVVPRSMPMILSMEVLLYRGADLIFGATFLSVDFWAKNMIRRHVPFDLSTVRQDIQMLCRHPTVRPIEVARQVHIRPGRKSGANSFGECKSWHRVQAGFAKIRISSFLNDGCSFSDEFSGKTADA